MKASRSRPPGCAARLLRAAASLALGWLLLSGFRPAEQLMKAGDFSGAATALERQETRRPRDARIKRDLGIARLRMGDARAALSKLEEARALQADDRTTLYFLGRAADEAGLVEKALEAYRACLARQPRDESAIRARVQVLSLRGMPAEIHRLVQNEKALSADSIPSNTIAVPQFAIPEKSDSLLVPMSKGVALVLTTDLSQVPGLRVVERERLAVLLDELRLADSTQKVPARPKRGQREAAQSPVRLVPVGKGSAPRLGRLLGARRFVQGGMVPLGQTDLQLGATVVELPDGRSLSLNPPAKGRLREVTILEKVLLFQILDSLRIDPGPELRSQLRQPPTRSFEAFLAFSRGVDFEDRGLTDRARQQYREALGWDPRFALARDRANLLDYGLVGLGKLDPDWVAELAPEAEGNDAAGRRLLDSAVLVGLGPGPGDPAVIGAGPLFTPETKAQELDVVIRGVLPR